MSRADGADFAIGTGHGYQGTVCPPVGVQLQIPLSELLDVVLDVDCVREDFDDVIYGKIPFFLGFVPSAADMFFFEEGEGAHG